VRLSADMSGTTRRLYSNENDGFTAAQHVPSQYALSQYALSQYVLGMTSPAGGTTSDDRHRGLASGLFMLTRR
jgi:hypothetical protein